VLHSKLKTDSQANFHNQTSPEAQRFVYSPCYTVPSDRSHLVHTTDQSSGDSSY